MVKVHGGDKAIALIAQLVSTNSQQQTLRVGFLEGSTYSDGTPVPLVAAVQEFGSPKNGIPPRPYFRHMVASKQSGWAPSTAALLRHNGYNGAQALQQLGAVIAGQLRQSIVDTNQPPLAPATVARKGFDKPLIDAGHMMSSIDWEVDSK